MAICLQGSPIETTEDAEEVDEMDEVDEVHMALEKLFDNIDYVDEEEDEEDDDTIDRTEEEEETGGGNAGGPHVRSGGPGGRGGARGGNRRGPGRGRRGQEDRGRGRGRGRPDGHPACPLMEESVEDMDAFVQECLKENKRVKMMIKKSRKNKRKPCDHECCEVGEGKKCCPVVDEGSCALVIKDAVRLKLNFMRQRGGKQQGQAGPGQGGRGRGQGQGQGRRGQAGPARRGRRGQAGPGRGSRGQAGRRQGGQGNSTCPNPQPFFRQLIACGSTNSKLLFVKGIPTALNPMLLCRADVDCAADEHCCSSAEDRCNRSCSKRESDLEEPATS